jgi:tRNA (adenine57-N1/adenine58-N1)-methyltransferase
VLKASKVRSARRLTTHLPTEITTQEVLTRTHEIVAPPKENASGPAPLRLVTDIAADLRSHEARKQERRAIQMKTAREKAQKKREEDAARAAKTAVEGGMGDGVDSDVEDRKRKADDAGDVAPKRIRLDEMSTTTAPRERIQWTEPANPFANIILSKPAYETRGHTSYLTFAALYPKAIRDQLAAQGAGGGKAEKAKDDETEYGSDGLDEVLGNLTDGEIQAMGE